MKGALDEHMGGVIVCDKVCLGMGSTSSFLLCNKSRSSPVDETPWMGMDDN